MRKRRQDGKRKFASGEMGGGAAEGGENGRATFCASNSRGREDVGCKGEEEERKEEMEYL